MVDERRHYISRVVDSLHLSVTQKSRSEEPQQLERNNSSGCYFQNNQHFINMKLQKLLKTRVIAHQLGARPNLGCQGAIFVLKTFLQE